VVDGGQEVGEVEGAEVEDEAFEAVLRVVLEEAEGC